MQIAWYINRLKSMSGREIAHRLGEQAKRSAWRSYADGWARFRIGDGPLPIVPGLARQIEDACARDPALRQRIHDESAKVLDGTLMLLGHRWPHGTLAGLQTDDRHIFCRDPVTNQIWPKADAYCFDVPYRHSAETGDVKFIWELNRLQFLQVVAAEARLTGDRALAGKVLRLLLVWIEQNPPFRGLNWCSGIELAMRIATLTLVLSLIEPVEDPDARTALRACINAHAFWLHRYPSLYSSANNHLIAEAMGLFLAGTLVPDLPKAKSMAAYGRTTLEREAARQIFVDGVGAEQSPTYTATTLEMLALARLVGTATGHGFSPAYDARLAAAADCLCWMTDAAGQTPAIGDNDEGRIVVLSGATERRYVASVAAAIGGLLKRPELAPLPRDPELRDAVFGSPPASTTGAGPSGLRVFEHGGYSVVRESRAGGRLFLVMDHGPLGYLSLAAHGHADALAIWLHVDEVPVFVDAGTFLYHAGGAWRDFFRSTAAHNTLTVDGKSSSTVSGPFNWRQKARARLVAHHPPPDWAIEAEHDGYVERYGVVHRRQVRRTPEGFEIADRLVGGACPVSIRFLLAPGLSAEAADEGWRILLPGGRMVHLHGPGGFTARKACGDESGPAGWVSPSFGLRLPAEQLTFDGVLGDDPAVTQVFLSSEKLAT